tara:strand:+ start:480 stop:770 length:291 start_codon:yes stop_codon:yes gene_type:complete
MAARLQLKTALKKNQNGVSNSKDLKDKMVKRVRFDLKPVYNKLKALERFNRRMVTIQQLSQGKYVSTGKLLLLLCEVRFTLQVLARKCKTTDSMAL